MRSLFWLLAVFAAAVAVLILGRVDAGYVLFVYPPYRVEMSMLFSAVAAAAAFVLLYLAARLLGQAFSLPDLVRAFRARRRRDRVHNAFASALQAYYEGRYARAEKDAAVVFEAGATPALAALLAARAAHQMRDFDRRDLWLERAGSASPHLPAAQLLTRAELPPQGAAAAARHAIGLGRAALAGEIIERALNEEWAPALVALYGELPEHSETSDRLTEALLRIESAERWLLERSRDPQLLATLGRLCAHAELWGKARSFLEASLSFEESRAARLDLARLAEHLGETADAQRHYRKAAELP